MAEKYTQFDGVEVHKPEKGDIYIHFKGNHYEVIGIAIDATNDKLYREYVVYKRLFKSQLYIRDIDEFMSEVDKTKYPDCGERWRFCYYGNRKDPDIVLDYNDKKAHRRWK